MSYILGDDLGPVEVVETVPFVAQAKGLLNHAEREELIDFLASNPATVAPLPRTGGVRKIRWAVKGKGKSGGVRVIYYYHSHQMPLYLVSVFSKAAKENLTSADEKIMRRFTAAIKKAYRKDLGYERI